MEREKFYCYEFGEYKLDARRRFLTKNGEKVSLSGRNFDLLLFMVENGGRILDHEELLEKVWAGTFVEQATLKKGISALRQILVETPDNEFIKTVPRRGYSFISQVRAVPEEGQPIIVRETAGEIIVEEYEVIVEDDDFSSAPKMVTSPVNPLAALLPAAETKKSNIQRLLIFGGAAIILVLAFFAVRPYFSKNSQQQFSAENIRITRITNSGNVTSGTTVSADGNYVVYPTFEKEGAVLWLRQILTNSAKKLTSPVPGNFYGFSIAPDNSYVYYIYHEAAQPQKSGLFKIPLLGGEPQRIAENVSSVLNSPDGKRLVLIRLDNQGTNIFTVNTSGEDEHPVMTLPPDYRLWNFRWTPDEKSLLCAIRKTVNGKTVFYVDEVAVENGAETVIIPEQEKVIFGAEWLPDKSAMLLVMRELNADIRQIWMYSPTTKEFRRVTNDNYSYKIATLTAKGDRIITNQESRQASIWQAENALPAGNSTDKKTSLIERDRFKRFTNSIGSFDRLGWLANGRMFYSTVEDAREVIFTVNNDGTNPTQITKGDDGIWISPIAGEDRQSIIYLSSKTGVRQAWRIDAEGKNPVQLTNVETQVLSARLLRDNATLFYVAINKNDESILYKKSADGQITQLTQTRTGNFTVSPDEKQMIVEIYDKTTGNYRVELRSLEDQSVIKTFDFQTARQLVFTPDGKSLAYEIRTGDTVQIMMRPLDGGDAYPITDFQSEDIYGFDWEPNTNRLAVIRGKQIDDVVLIKSNSQ